MPRRRRVAKARRMLRSFKDLTSEQDWEFLLGPNSERGGGSAFESEEAAREAWFALRNDYLTTCRPFVRPHGWWRFESPEPKRITGYMDVAGGIRVPEKENDRTYLTRHGLLTDHEREVEMKETT